MWKLCFFECIYKIANNMKYSFLLLIVFVTVELAAQSKYTIGEKHQIESKILGQERVVYVHLPKGYEHSETAYPVLYILDGQWHFTNGVAIQESLRTPDALPQMIVVGIVDKNPERRTLLGSQREKFLAHLEKELIPFIDAQFKTTNDRVLFGWEAGAYFSSHVLLHDTQLFNAAILSNGGYVSAEEVEHFSGADLTEDRYMYIANSKKDIYYVSSSDGLAERLNELSPKHLKWKYELFNDEVHESLAYLALYHGLKYYYHNFNSLVFSSIDSYNELGGMDYIKEYYNARGKRFGLPLEPDNSVKNSLIWLAWNRNNYEYFHMFMTEFSDVLSTQRYASAYWQNRLGQFYLKHKNYESAIGFFETGIEKYPDASRMASMYFGLGMAWAGKGDKKQAKKNIKMAIALAEKTGEAALSEYQEQLKSM